MSGCKPMDQNDKSKAVLVYIFKGQLVADCGCVCVVQMINLRAGARYT